MKAGMEIANMVSPETPDARKDAVAAESPACANKVGAYWKVYNISRSLDRKE